MSTFTAFYTAWSDQLQQLLRQLCSAPKPPTTQDHLHHLNHLVNKVLSHYAEYYRVKAAAAERDVLDIFAAPWASAFEKSLHWIAGWRPTTVFHLVYTESSILFESHIVDILRGVRTGDLGDLSPTQFRLSRSTCMQTNGFCFFGSNSITSPSTNLLIVFLL